MTKAKTLHDAAHKWLRANHRELQHYPGRYVVVTGSGIEMADESEENLMKRSTKAGNPNPLIVWAGKGFEEA